MRKFGLLLAAGAVAAICTSSAHDAKAVILYAGQDIDVGQVTASCVGGKVQVTYDTTEPWYLLAYHLEVRPATDTLAAVFADLLTNKNNPKVGQFMYSDALMFPTTDPVDVLTDVNCGDVFVAAHAEVAPADSVCTEPTGEGPFDEGLFVDTVLDANQGLRRDGSAVLSERSDPMNAEGIADSDPNRDGNPDNLVDTFFSLGFGFDDGVPVPTPYLSDDSQVLGGDLLASFGTPVCNGPGDDVRVWEVTNGRDGGNPYPTETALVEGCDGAGDNCNGFGTVDNESDFGPGTAGDGIAGVDFVANNCYPTIKVTDYTDKSLFNGSGARGPEADAYDVDALSACYPLNLDDEETAWGEGQRFTDQGNWATVFRVDLTPI